MAYMNVTKASARGADTKAFDAFKREWVECDYLGMVNGVPVPTTTIVRRLRGMAPVQAVKEFNISPELAEEWCKKAHDVCLVLFDSRSRYRYVEETGFEDEEALERGAISYKDLNLPVAMVERLLEVKRKNGYLL